MWTKFWDMSSGGSEKLDWKFIFIEAEHEEAQIIFQNKFGRNPNRVTCTCCGPDYSVDINDTLEQATAFHRNCKYAFLDKDGKEVSQDIAFISGEGIQDGYVGKYIEIQKDDAYGFMMNDGKLMTIKQFEEEATVLIIRKEDITDEERVGTLEEEGYVWK